MSYYSDESGGMYTLKDKVSTRFGRHHKDETSVSKINSLIGAIGAVPRVLRALASFASTVSGCMKVALSLSLPGMEAGQSLRASCPPVAISLSLSLLPLSQKGLTVVNPRAMSRTGSYCTERRENEERTESN